MAIRHPLLENGKFFIYADTSKSLDQEKLSMAAFLNSLIKKEYRALIREDYDIELVERDSLGIGQDDRFIARINNLAEKYPRPKTQRK